MSQKYRTKMQKEPVKLILLVSMVLVVSVSENNSTSIQKSRNKWSQFSEVKKGKKKGKKKEKNTNLILTNLKIHSGGYD